MLINQWKQLVIGLFVVFLGACAETLTVPGIDYKKVGNAHLYNVNAWRLEGRLAISSSDDSWSANLQWDHYPDSEKLKLSGPLGQGAVVVNLTGDTVSIDRGDGRVQTSRQPEQLIGQQLGIEVPLQFLRFWAVGLPEPGHSYQETVGGFIQSGWLVDFRQMQKVGGENLPQKISVTNSRVKMKLVIDQWSFHGTKLN